MPDTTHPTSAQLKHDIDSGRTGDKIAGFDPAAAPLGTDEEAGGYSPTGPEIAQARALETGRGVTSRSTNSAEPRLAPDATLKDRPRLPMAALVAIAMIAIAAAAFAFMAA